MNDNNMSVIGINTRIAILDQVRREVAEGNIPPSMLEQGYTYEECQQMVEDNIMPQIRNLNEKLGEAKRKAREAAGIPHPPNQVVGLQAAVLRGRAPAPGSGGGFTKDIGAPSGVIFLPGNPLSINEKDTLDESMEYELEFTLGCQKCGKLSILRGWPSVPAKCNYCVSPGLALKKAVIIAKPKQS